MQRLSSKRVRQIEIRPRVLGSTVYSYPFDLPKHLQRKSSRNCYFMLASLYHIFQLEPCAQAGIPTSFFLTVTIFMYTYITYILKDDISTHFVASYTLATEKLNSLASQLSHSFSHILRPGCKVITCSTEKFTFMYDSVNGVKVQLTSKFLLNHLNFSLFQREARVLSHYGFA